MSTRPWTNVTSGATMSTGVHKIVPSRLTSRVRCMLRTRRSAPVHANGFANETARDGGDGSRRRGRPGSGPAAQHHHRESARHTGDVRRSAYNTAIWQDANLVFCHEDGRMYTSDALNWRFGKMTRRAGIGHWHAHEGRHTAVSIMSSNGVVLAEISSAQVGQLFGFGGGRMSVVTVVAAPSCCTTSFARANLLSRLR